MGIVSTLLRAVTWWNGQTLNTQLFTWRRGVKVGEDDAGNMFYETKDRVKRWVKLFAMVNCGPDFVQQPQVINGASDVLVDIFGDAGRHARSAVGMSSLPVGISVEIEAVVEIG